MRPIAGLEPEERQTGDAGATRACATTRPFGRWRPYVIATALVAAALLLHIALAAPFAGRFPFLLFTLAIVISAWIGGFGPALFATLLSALVVGYVLLEPRVSLQVLDPGELLALGLFGVVGVTMSAIGGRMLRARDRAEAVSRRSLKDRSLLEREIGERRQAEAAYRRIVETANEGICIVGRDGRISYANARLAEMVGVAVEALQGRSAFDFLYDEDDARREFRATIKRRRHGFDLLLRGHGGATVCVSVSASTVFDEAGALIGMLAMLTDVTERRRTEDALRKSEERFRVAQELSLDAFTILEAVRDGRGRIEDFRWLYANPVAAKVLQRPREALVGARLLEVLPGNELASELFKRYLRVVETGQPHDIEVSYEADGITGWFRNMAVKLDDGVAIYFADITQRKQTLQALREADRRKDEFLAMLAHELRNPLAPIRNAVQVLRQLGPLESKLEWALDIIDRQVTHLSRIIDDLLDVSRITRGKITLHKEPVALAAIIERAVETARPLIEARHHKLVVELAPQPVWLQADPVRLAQAISNLLHNAAKYTDDGGTIWLDASAGAGEVVISVRDTGIGIAPDLLPSIFDLFAQAERSLDRSQGGLGIGLTLVRKLIELHGGQVRASSPGIGQGSDFTIRLPALTSVQALPGKGANGGSAAQASRRLRVLLVDDNRDAVDSLALLLSLEGHEVRTAQEGRAALDEARAFVPDAAVLDIGLPGMDGYELAQRLRLQDETKHAVLIALTGYGQDRDRERSKLAGFDHHLVKPADPVELSRILETVDAAGGARGGRPAA